MLKITDQMRTKSGTKRHREECRFARKDAFLCEDNPKDRKLKPCEVCKPHQQHAPFLPELGKARHISACGICLKGKGLPAVSREDAVKEGFKVTKTGTKYHSAICKHAGGKGVHVKAKPAAPKAKAPKVAPQAAPQAA